MPEPSPPRRAPASPRMVDGMINAQAAMIAYLDDFKLMFIITLCAAPLILLLRHRPIGAPAPGAPPAAPAMAD